LTSQDLYLLADTSTNTYLGGLIALLKIAYSGNPNHFEGEIYTMAIRSTCTFSQIASLLSLMTTYDKELILEKLAIVF
jgi:hypothetical protein